MEKNKILETNVFFFLLSWSQGIENGSPIMEDHVSDAGTGLWGYVRVRGAESKSSYGKSIVEVPGATRAGASLSSESSSKDPWLVCWSNKIGVANSYCMFNMI